MNLIDCHAHLADTQFDQDVGDVVERAKQSGVKGVVVVSEHKNQFSRIIELADCYKDFCLPSFGVHPVQLDSEGKERSAAVEDLDSFRPLVEQFHDRLVCIGEVGLDFTPRWCATENDKDAQKKVLLSQIEVAQQYNLPINVHSRSAGRPTIALLKEAGSKKVLLHAFDGKPSVAMAGVQCGFYFSIPPSIVRSQQEKLVRTLPLDNILLESDSPALGPNRLERNEPSNVSVACEYIAAIKGVSVASVAQITSENALKLFPKIAEYLRVDNNDVVT